MTTIPDDALVSELAGHLYNIAIREG